MQNNIDHVSTQGQTVDCVDDDRDITTKKRLPERRSIKQDHGGDSQPTSGRSNSRRGVRGNSVSSVCSPDGPTHSPPPGQPSESPQIVSPPDRLGNHKHPAAHRRNRVHRAPQAVCLSSRPKINLEYWNREDWNCVASPERLEGGLNGLSGRGIERCGRSLTKPAKRRRQNRSEGATLRLVQRYKPKQDTRRTRSDLPYHPHDGRPILHPTQPPPPGDFRNVVKSDSHIRWGTPPGPRPSAWSHRKSRKIIRRSTPPIISCLFDHPDQFTTFSAHKPNDNDNDATKGEGGEDAGAGDKGAGDNAGNRDAASYNGDGEGTSDDNENSDGDDESKNSSSSSSSSESEDTDENGGDFSRTIPPFDPHKDSDLDAAYGTGDKAGPRTLGSSTTHFDRQYYRRIHGEPSHDGGYPPVKDGDDEGSARDLYDPFSQSAPVFDGSSESSKESDGASDGSDDDDNGEVEEGPEHHAESGLANEEPDSRVESGVSEDGPLHSGDEEEEPPIFTPSNTPPTTPPLSPRRSTAGGATATNGDRTLSNGVSPDNRYAGHDTEFNAPHEPDQMISSFSSFSSSRICSCNYYEDASPCTLSDDGFILVNRPTPTRHGGVRSHTPVRDDSPSAHEMTDSSPRPTKSSLSPHAPVFHCSGRNEPALPSLPEAPPISPRLPLPPQSLEDWKYRYSDPALTGNSWDITATTGGKRGGRLPVPKRVMGLLDEDEMFAGESCLSPENPIWNYSFWKHKYSSAPV
ncbi:hypothetical protein B0T19DRAFT_80342 [Cercophora scortea]|uniref:Uncharacterized protein n=1 Tax=Cercophora scortea TaxID=314031 RepID=A0AAE0MNJ6_9PEZI|nr:hypothetical protein B0T19DRAFT_80342 [Cercophora scortea]